MAHKNQFELVDACVGELEDQIAGLRQHIDMRRAI
jgi:hypothetical protein